MNIAIAAVVGVVLAATTAVAGVRVAAPPAPSHQSSEAVVGYADE